MPSSCAELGFGRLIFGPRLAPPQLIEANVGDDAIEPGIKAALETESMEVAVDLQEGFLVDVARVLGTLHQVQRQPQHVAVVAAHQFLERMAGARLRLDHQTALVQLGQGSHRCQRGIGLSRLARHIRQSQSR